MGRCHDGLLGELPLPPIPPHVRQLSAWSMRPYKRCGFVALVEGRSMDPMGHWEIRPAWGSLWVCCVFRRVLVFGGRGNTCMRGRHAICTPLLHRTCMPIHATGICTHCMPFRSSCIGRWVPRELSCEAAVVVAVDRDTAAQADVLGRFFFFFFTHDFFRFEGRLFG